jgi:hypothetical protein
VLLEAFLAQRDHLLGRVDFGEQPLGRLVHPDIGRLRRQRDGDEQCVGIGPFQFGLGVRIVRGQPFEKFEDLCLVHTPST